ncbi:hypothetical protein M8J76_015621 [Diaphorina citri]|nr:hypothetical protein M8J75_008434 [Diaphorina citri]KAI5741637.1 hypothetical protein M8J76_015621 [Diaphorina citri]
MHGIDLKKDSFRVRNTLAEYQMVFSHQYETIKPSWLFSMQSCTQQNYRTAACSDVLNAEIPIINLGEETVLLVLLRRNNLLPFGNKSQAKRMY